MWRRLEEEEPLAVKEAQIFNHLPAPDPRRRPNIPPIEAPEPPQPQNTLSAGSTLGKEAENAKPDGTNQSPRFEP